MRRSVDVSFPAMEARKNTRQKPLSIWVKSNQSACIARVALGIAQAVHHLRAILRRNRHAHAVCRDLWIWVICASFALAALITLVIGRKMLREQFEHCRTEKRLEARISSPMRRRWRSTSGRGRLASVCLASCTSLVHASFSFPVMSAFNLQNRLYSVKLTL